MPEQKTVELWLLYHLYGTDVQGVTVLMDVLCPRGSKAGTGAAMKLSIHRPSNSQCALYPFLDSPVLGQICISHM